MTAPVAIEFPYRLRHHANTNMHWRARAGQARKVRDAVRWNLVMLGKYRPKVPCRVTITRYAPRPYDPDNLVHACKHVVDEIAKWIGVDDRHDDKVRYVSQQIKSREYLVRIVFEDIEPGDPNDPESI